jgi:hypothetical protein
MAMEADPCHKLRVRAAAIAAAVRTVADRTHADAHIAIEEAYTEVAAAALPTPAASAGAAHAHPAAATCVVAALTELPKTTHAYTLQTDGSLRNANVDRFIDALIIFLKNSNVPNKAKIADAVELMTPTARKLLAAAFWVQCVPNTTPLGLEMATTLQTEDPTGHAWVHKLAILAKLWNIATTRAKLAAILCASSSHDRC